MLFPLLGAFVVTVVIEGVASKWQSPEYLGQCTSRTYMNQYAIREWAGVSSVVSFSNDDKFSSCSEQTISFSADYTSLTYVVSSTTYGYIWTDDQYYRPQPAAIPISPLAPIPPAFDNFYPVPGCSDVMINTECYLGPSARYDAYMMVRDPRAACVPSALTYVQQNFRLTVTQKQVTDKCKKPSSKESKHSKESKESKESDESKED